MFNFDPSKVNLAKLLWTSNVSNFYAYKEKWMAKRSKTRDFKQAQRNLVDIVLAFSCNHQNVLPVKGFDIDFEHKKQKWDIYTKYPLVIQNLKDRYEKRLKSIAYINEEELIKYFQGLADGIQYLHTEKNIALVEIRMENIMLTKENEIKISGLGSALCIGEESTYFHSDDPDANQCIAPELRSGAKLKKKELYKADLWSLGIIMAKLCILDKNLNNWSLVTDHDYENRIINGLQNLKEKYSSKLINLISNLIKRNPNERYSIEKVQEILKSKEISSPTFSIPMGNFNETKKPIEKKNATQIEESKVNRPKDSNIDSFDDVSFDEPIKSSEEVLFKKMKEEEFVPSNEEITLIKMNKKELGVENQSKEMKKAIKDEFKASSPEFSTEILNVIKKIEIPKVVKDDLNTIRKKMQESNFDISNKKIKFSIVVTELNRTWESSFKIFVRENLASLAIQSKKPEESILTDHICVLTINRTTDATISQFTEKISKEVEARNLKDQIAGVSVALRFCKNITWAGIEALTNCFKMSFNSITHLELDFWGCSKVKDLEIKNLAGKITTNHRSLEHLGFFFNECLSISDQGIIGLADEVCSKMKPLRHFKLNINGCPRVSDSAIKHLNKQIALNLVNLTSLELYFCGVSLLTDDSIKDLGEKASLHLQRLKSFRLAISGCIEVTQNAILNLAKLIKTNLKSLNLIQLSCYDIEFTPEGKNSLKNTFNNIQNIIEF